MGCPLAFRDCNSWSLCRDGGEPHPSLSRGGLLISGEVSVVQCGPSSLPGRRLARASRCQAETSGTTHPGNGVGPGGWRWAVGSRAILLRPAGECRLERVVQPSPSPHPPGNPCSNPPPSCHSLLAPPSLCRDKVLPHLYPSATPSLVASPAPKRQSSLLPCCPQSLPPASKVTALSSPPYTPILTNTSSPGLSRPGPSSHRAQELLASPRSL